MSHTCTYVYCTFVNLTTSWDSTCNWSRTANWNCLWTVLSGAILRARSVRTFSVGESCDWSCLSVDLGDCLINWSCSGSVGTIDVGDCLPFGIVGNFDCAIDFVCCIHRIFPDTRDQSLSTCSKMELWASMGKSTTINISIDNSPRCLLSRVCFFCHKQVCVRCACIYIPNQWIDVLCVQGGGFYLCHPR